VCPRFAGVDPPNKNYAKDTSLLVNPAYPWETNQDAFVKSMEHSQSEQATPFISLKIVDRMWKETLDLIKNRLMTPE